MTSDLLTFQEVCCSAPFSHLEGRQEGERKKNTGSCPLCHPPDAALAPTILTRHAAESIDFVISRKELRGSLQFRSIFFLFFFLDSVPPLPPSICLSMKLLLKFINEPWFERESCSWLPLTWKLDLIAAFLSSLIYADEFERSDGG